MPIRFRCDYCGQLLSIASRKAGAVVACPKCQHENTVPVETSLASRGDRTSQFFESSRFDEWIGRLADDDSMTSTEQPRAISTKASPGPTREAGSPRPARSVPFEAVEPWQPEPERLPSRVPPPSPASASIDEPEGITLAQAIAWGFLAVLFLLISFALGLFVGRYGFPSS